MSAHKVSHDLVVLPHKGLGALLFGSTQDLAREIYGEPAEVEQLNSVDEKYKTTVWHYWQMGFSVFFDEDAHNTFTCAEVDNANCVLWGAKIFTLSEKEIIALFKSKGYKEMDVETHEWGESG